MINKKKVFKSLIIILLIIIIIFVAIQIRNTLARYETTTTTQRDVDVAFWIVDNSFKSERLIIDDIYPKDTAYEYQFTVSNFNGNKIAETDMEYDIILTSTTNLPLKYEISRNGTTYTNLQQELITDADGTVYKKIKFGTEENPYPLIMDTVTEEKNENGSLTGKYVKGKITDTYILKVTFPTQSYVNGVLTDNKTNLDYPDAMENIEINLTARQKID